MRISCCSADVCSSDLVGSGAFIVGAGAVIVVVFMTGVIGVQVGLEGYEGLELIGAEDLIGFLSAFANVREITPLASSEERRVGKGCVSTCRSRSWQVH